jgi:hypothetical protein
MDSFLHHGVNLQRPKMAQPLDQSANVIRLGGTADIADPRQSGTSKTFINLEQGIKLLALLIRQGSDQFSQRPFATTRPASDAHTLDSHGCWEYDPFIA